jgi:hypothetical protein
MSSVTRFIRQIPVSTTYYDAAGVVTAASSPASQITIYEFYNDGSNYVGNYPPGYVLPASNALCTQIVAASSVGGVATPQGLVLRDMGKTIYASYGALNTSADPRNTPSTVSYGYFRQVQLLKPTAIGFGTGNQIIGGTSGSNFGVLGAQNNPDNYTDFLTFYIPVTVAGVRGPVVNTAAYAIAGGQM